MEQFIDRVVGEIEEANHSAKAGNMIGSAPASAAVHIDAQRVQALVKEVASQTIDRETAQKYLDVFQETLRMAMVEAARAVLRRHFKP